MEQCSPIRLVIIHLECIVYVCFPRSVLHVPFPNRKIFLIIINFKSNIECAQKIKNVAKLSILVYYVEKVQLYAWNSVLRNIVPVVSCLRCYDYIFAEGRLVTFGTNRLAEGDRYVKEAITITLR